MTLPNDGLTLKEVREINGTPTSYRLNEPVQWADFRAWPEDIQREYLEGLQSKYHVGLNEIARMMGAEETSFTKWRKEREIQSVLGKGRAYPLPEWADFKARAAWLEQAPEPEPETKPAPDPAPLRAKNVPLAKRTELDDLLHLLPELKASGAKIKIEVEL